MSESDSAGRGRTLPLPATTTELYLAAILDELRALHGELGRPPLTRADLMQIRGVGERTAEQIVELLEGR